MKRLPARLVALPLWASVIAAAVGGIVLGAAFPTLSLWPLAFAGVFIILWSLNGRTWASGLLIGLVSGAMFWGPLIHWLTLYLGPVPWLGLAGVQTVYFVIFGAVAAVVLRHGPTVWSTTRKRLIFIPLVLAGLWVAREGIAAVWPYGGFAWGRLAQSQSESGFGPLVAWCGTAGLSFLIAWSAAFVFEAIRVRRFLRVGAITILVLVCAVAFPRFPVATSGTIRLAAVQGNTKSALFDVVEPGQNVIDHAETTLTYVKSPVDVVIWPENASDVDPTRFKESAQVLDYLSAKYNAPFIVGTITEPRDGVYFNSSLVWMSGQGVTAQYDKIHPVPFAEYMPNRDFFHALAPDLVDMVTHDYSFGTRSNVVQVAGTNIGLSICFDIVDDQQIFDMLSSGANIIVAQTNNADFGYSEESAQQLAIARLRAIETGRTLVNISTVGISSIIGPDGQTIDSLPEHTRGAMTNTLNLSSSTTPAMVIGRGIEWLLGAIGLVGFALCSFASRRLGRGRGEREGN